MILFWRKFEIQIKLFWLNVQYYNYFKQARELGKFEEKRQEKATVEDLLEIAKKDKRQYVRVRQIQRFRNDNPNIKAPREKSSKSMKKQADNE